MADNNRHHGKARGRGAVHNHQPCSSAGAGGDNQTSTLNAEAPEFRPTVSLMEHMHLDQTRYAGHQQNFQSPQNRSPMQYSAAVSGNNYQTGGITDLVGHVVVRIRQSEKVSSASDQLIQRLTMGKGAEEVMAVAKTLTHLGANEDRTKVDAVFQLALHLADKLRPPHLPFAQYMLREMSDRLVHWHRSCASNSGFVPQCGPFLVMLMQLFPAMAQRGQQATIQLGLNTISFVHLLMMSQDGQAHHHALQLLCQLGPTLQDELAGCDKDDRGRPAETLENLYDDVRRGIAQGHFGKADLAVNFIEMLELRATNWGRLFSRPASNEGGGISRQNSEAMMDDEMYECYEKFLAETGQI